MGHLLATTPCAVAILCEHHLHASRIRAVKAKLRNIGWSGVWRLHPSAMAGHIVRPFLDNAENSNRRASPISAGYKEGSSRRGHTHPSQAGDYFARVDAPSPPSQKKLGLNNYRLLRRFLSLLPLTFSRRQQDPGELEDADYVLLRSSGAHNPGTGSANRNISFGICRMSSTPTSAMPGTGSISKGGRAHIESPLRKRTRKGAARLGSAQGARSFVVALATATCKSHHWRHAA